MPLERACTLLGYATVLRRTKRKHLATLKLEEALAVFHSLGASAWINGRRPSSVVSLPPRPARLYADADRGEGGGAGGQRWHE